MTQEKQRLQWEYAAAGLVSGAVLGAVTALAWAAWVILGVREGDAGLPFTALMLGVLVGATIGGLTGAVVSFLMSNGKPGRSPSIALVFGISAFVTVAIGVMTLGADGLALLLLMCWAPCIVLALTLPAVARRIRARFLPEDDPAPR